MSITTQNSRKIPSELKDETLIQYLKHVRLTPRPDVLQVELMK